MAEKKDAKADEPELTPAEQLAQELAEQERKTAEALRGNVDDAAAADDSEAVRLRIAELKAQEEAAKESTTGGLTNKKL